MGKNLHKHKRFYNFGATQSFYVLAVRSHGSIVLEILRYCFILIYYRICMPKTKYNRLSIILTFIFRSPSDNFMI